MHVKIFKSGNSQAVRLPREFRFDDTEVEIYKEGDKVILMPIEKSRKSAFDCLTRLPDDFMQEGREQEHPEDREPFKAWIISLIPISVFILQSRSRLRLSKSLPYCRWVRSVCRW